MESLEGTKYQVLGPDGVLHDVTSADFDEKRGVIVLKVDWEAETHELEGLEEEK